MSQFPEFDKRRMAHYSAIGTGLLVFIVLMTLDVVLDWVGSPIERGWGRIILIVAVAGGVSLPAQLGAKWLVRRYPTTHATYD